MHKIDSVKHFPLHPLGKSVEEIFRGYDTEYEEVYEGAKEAEETGACGAFLGGRILAGIGFAGIFGWGLFGDFPAVSFIKKSK